MVKLWNFPPVLTGWLPFVLSRMFQNLDFAETAPYLGLGYPNLEMPILSCPIRGLEGLVTSQKQLADFNFKPHSNPWIGTEQTCFCQLKLEYTGV
jgi:hypothetical protein